MTDMFVNEEVASSCTYPESYKLKSIEEQVDRLHVLFPSITLSINGASREAAVPAIMEGYFVIPRWEAVSKTYNGAVKRVIALITSTRRLCNYHEGQIGPKYLRQSARAADMFRKLGDQQKGHNLLVVPAQFGLRHRGRSGRRAREVFARNEFGLGTFATGIMLLTHPERLDDYENLRINCAGDECAPEADGDFYGTPYWHFRDYELRFGYGDSIYVDPLSGSASARLPK